MRNLLSPLFPISTLFYVRKRKMDLIKVQHAGVLVRDLTIFFWLGITGFVSVWQKIISFMT